MSVPVAFPKVAVMLGCLFLATGCRERPPKALADAPAPANEVTIRARDFGFDAPAEIPAGRVTLRLVNDGPDIHHVQLIRFTDGKTMADLAAALQAMKGPGPFPAWAREVGGPNVPTPGGSSVGVLDLEPGQYALVCFIDTPDRVPHVMKGMAQPLTVVPASANTAQPAAIEPTLTMALDDFSFELSDTIRAGEQVILVKGGGTQAHEAVILRFEPGQSLEGAAQWAATYTGPLPATPMGGTTALAPGASQYVKVNLPPGNYALLCFVPDVTDGQPHIAHGMVKPFTVN